MGYRLYLGKIPKNGMRKYRKATQAELAREFREEGDSESEYFSVTSFPHLTELHELGKYVDFSTGKKYKKFFSFEDPDSEFIVVDKQFLADIIEDYRKNTHEMFVKQNALLTKIMKGNKTLEVVVEELTHLSKQPEYSNEDAETLMSLRHRLGMLEFEWSIVDGHPHMYDLEGKRRTEPMNTSWRYEYAIFNLIYIYKTFDFKKNYMVYYGY
jgi:hypothetical protein